MSAVTPFDFIQAATSQHRAHHDCGAYTFEDGAGLIAVAKAQAPRRVIELGTALGYTACCLASATSTTVVDTVERDPDHVRLAREQVTQAGLEGRVVVHEGDFLAVLTTLTGPYDLAFFDGFAPDEALIGRLRSLLADEGVLVCANLGLAAASSREALRRDLDDPTRWTRIGALEQGATLAWRKRADG